VPYLSAYSYGSLLDSSGLIQTPRNLTIIPHWPFGPLLRIGGSQINTTSGIFDGWGQ
jgi:S1-C subfamily serine protease